MRKSLLLIALVAFLITVFFVILFSLQKPDRVVNSAFSKIGRVENQNFSATLKLSNASQTEQLLGETATIELTVVGVLQKHEDRLDWNIIAQNRSISLSLFEKHIDKVELKWIAENNNLTRQLKYREVKPLIIDLLC